MKVDIRYILPAALAADLMIPFLMAPFYKGYSHTAQVMSVLGNHRAPLHSLYNGWLILLGGIILCSSFSLRRIAAEHSRPLSTALFWVLIIYSVGGCILSGLFSVGETKKLVTFSAKVHGYGAAIGFMVLTSAPAIISIYYLKTNRLLLAVVSLLCFIAALVFFILFIMADKPKYQNSVIALEGLWQRLTLLFMYLPVSVVCMEHLCRK